MATRALVLALITLAAGCSCRKETDLQPIDTEVPTDPSGATGDDDDTPYGDEGPGANAPADWGQWLSADVAPDGDRISVAYYDPTAEGIGYATVAFDADGDPIARHERVDGYTSGDNDVGRYASQLTDIDGTAWVVYLDADDDVLKARHRTGLDTWGAVEIVGPGGRWNDVALDADGRLMVAHTGEDGILRISRRLDNSWQTDEAYTSVATDWNTPDGGVVTRPAEVAQPRIHVDGATTYVLFYDKAAGELHMLSGSYGNFRDERVRGDIDEGAWPSVVSHQGQIFVAYQHVGNGDLILANRASAGAWSFQVVDDGPLVGSDTEVFVHDGKVHILYFQGFDSDLFLAVDDGGWQIQRLEGGATAAGFHNETVAVGGRRYVLTYDYTDRGVLFLPL